MDVILINKVLLLAIAVSTGITTAMLLNKFISTKDVTMLGSIVSRLYMIYIALRATFIDCSCTQIFVPFLAVTMTDILTNIIMGKTSSIHTALQCAEYVNQINAVRGNMVKVMDRSSVGFYIVDPDGRIEYVNDIFCSILGYDREDLLGTSILNLVHEKHRETFLCKLAAGCKTSTVFEVTLLSKDGSPIKARVVGSETVNGHPTITGNIMAIS